MLRSQEQSVFAQSSRNVISNTGYHDIKVFKSFLEKTVMPLVAYIGLGKCFPSSGREDKSIDENGNCGECERELFREGSMSNTRLGKGRQGALKNENCMLEQLL